MFAAELGTDHFDPIPDEPDPVLHPDDDHALEPGEAPDDEVNVHLGNPG